VSNVDATKNSGLLNAASIKAMCAFPNEFIVYIFNVDDLHRMDKAAGTHSFSMYKALLS